MKADTKSTSIHIRINPQVKEKAAPVLKDIGISYSDLFIMLLNQVAIQHRIPFELVDSHYVCSRGNLHDYSKISPSDESEYSKAFDNLDDLWAELEI